MYEQLEPFDIDDGSLEGVEAPLCFVLGVEWLNIFNMLRAPNAPRCIVAMVHTQNVLRLTGLGERRGYLVSSYLKVEGWHFMRFIKGEEE